MGDRGRQSLRPSLRTVGERNRLVEQWQHLPKFCVHKLQNIDAVRGIGFDAAVSLGCLALIRAAELWDEQRHVKFVTYAATSITTHVLRYAVKEYGCISVPLHQHGRTPKFAGDAQRALAINSLHRLGVNTAEQVAVGDDTEPSRPFPIEELGAYLWQLEPRERSLLRLYFWAGMNYQQIATRIGLSKEAARTAVVRAVLKLRVLILGADHRLSRIHKLTRKNTPNGHKRAYNSSGGTD